MECDDFNVSSVYYKINRRYNWKKFFESRVKNKNNNYFEKENKKK